MITINISLNFSESYWKGAYRERGFPRYSVPGAPVFVAGLFQPTHGEENPAPAFPQGDKGHLSPALLSVNHWFGLAGALS